MTAQLERIKKKASFMFVELYLYLINVSTYRRRDIWKTIVVSLFNDFQEVPHDSYKYKFKQQIVSKTMKEYT